MGREPGGSAAALPRQKVRLRDRILQRLVTS